MNIDMTFDTKYDITLKVLYKHFIRCPYNSSNLPNEDGCVNCASVKNSIVETLHEAPVFIIEAGKLDYFTSLFKGIGSKSFQQAASIIKSSVINTDKKISDEALNTIQQTLTSIEEAQKTLDKGYPFEQFIVLFENPIMQNDTTIVGCLYRELSPERWTKFPAVYNSKENSTYCARGGVFGADDHELKALEHLLNTQERVELEDFNIKARVGYYNPALPRAAKAKPIHIVYFETKKQFILKHPQYEAKILREPKLAHLVRGHWRKLHDGQKHGKDRHGYPIFNGYTWVIPHKRGKGDLPETTIYVAQ